MLNPVKDREANALRDIAFGAHAKGVALVIGYCPDIVDMLCYSQDITRLIYVPGQRGPVPRHPKLTVLMDVLPHFAQRRDVGLDRVDFLFVATGHDPWDRDRPATVLPFTREFRPRATAYKHMQLDLASEWLGAGMDPNKIDQRVFALFAKNNGFLVKPDTAEFATGCIETAKEFMGARA